jgi:hypothetical protein
MEEGLVLGQTRPVRTVAGKPESSTKDKQTLAVCDNTARGDF